jgi:alpha-tubulin suppressor-like RCC1 family protein
MLATGDVYVMGGFDLRFYSSKTRNMLLPRSYSLKNVIEAALGNTNLAITAHGLVYGWGKNLYGQLGFGDRGDREDPTELIALRNKRIMYVAKTSHRSLFLSRTGEVYICGGDASEDLILSVKYTNISKIACSQSHSYVLDSK